jgi:hypothetical protein
MVGEKDLKDHGELFSQTLGKHRKDRAELICALFPTVADQIKTGVYINDGDNYPNMLLKRRIAVEPAYDAYFSLFPSDNIITKADIENFVAHFDDRQYLHNFMCALADRWGNVGQNLVGDLFEQTRYAIKDRGMAFPTKALLQSLFDVGDMVLAVEDNRMVILGARAQLEMLSKEVVSKLGETQALPTLIELFESTDSVAFAADFWVDRGRELGVFSSEGGRRDGPLSMASFEALSKPLRNLIDRKMKDGSLASAPFFFDILRSWTHIDRNPIAARNWLAAKVMADPKILAKTALGLLSYSVNDDGSRRYGLSRSSRELSDPANAFYDMEAILKATEKWAGAEGLSQDELARIEALGSGLRHLEEGTSPEDW